MASGNLFAHGIDLFDHGFYWEAHEAWERLWQAAPRDGAESRLLQGLIALAAAGVKVRQGQTIGIARHARRAEEFFTGLPAAGLRGFSRDDLLAYAREIAPMPARPAVDEAPEIVFPRALPISQG